MINLVEKEGFGVSRAKGIIFKVWIAVKMPCPDIFAEVFQLFLLDLLVQFLNFSANLIIVPLGKSRSKELSSLTNKL